VQLAFTTSKPGAIINPLSESISGSFASAIVADKEKIRAVSKNLRTPPPYAST
jgi:hypothetical protein